MRTSVDIPDALLEQLRRRLKTKGMTLREAILSGLRRTLLADEPSSSFQLRDAAFVGEVGFAEGFDPDQLTGAVHHDAEQRFAADDRHGYQP